MPTPLSQPLRRFRFGLRTLFVVVTVAAAAATGWNLWRRSEVLHVRALWHLEEASTPIFYENRTEEDAAAMQETLDAYFEYHRQMADKYARAAKHPWLPLDPDPPEPDIKADPPATQ